MVLVLAHSHYSLLRAPCAPRLLCEEAVRLGHEHLGLADLDGLYGFLAFAREARRVRLRALFGVELVQGGRRLVAIARDRAGYASLCSLVSARHLDADFDLARDAARHAEGLFLLSRDPRLLLELAGRAPEEALFALLEWPAEPELLAAAAALGVPPLAAWPAWYARPEDRFAQQVFLAVGQNAALPEGEGEGDEAPEDDDAAAVPAPPGRETWRPKPAECRPLPTRDEVRRFTEAHPEAAARARALVERCTLDFAGDAPPVFPDFHVPEGATPAGELRRLAEAGLARRYGAAGAAGTAVRRRLERELSVIEAMGFAPYFLVVREIAGLAWQRGIPVVGRGSAADSLVAYCLGLTEADPVRYGLLFERFLNPARRDRPDIDLDFCWRRRDELLEAVYARFGREHVAMIATYSTCGPRGAYREAAKALGLPPREADRRAALLPWHDRGGSLAEMIAATPGFLRGGPALEPEREVRIAHAADLLLAAPRHLGMHPGGVVITPDPIVRHVPLQRAAKGLVITQYDMRFVEELGLVKIDLLGNRALSILADALGHLRAHGLPAPDLERIPEDDPATGRLLREGRTLGCFQVESPAMRTLLRQMQAADMDRVIQAVALVRPGPSACGMKERFVRRARGLEPVTVAHPVLEPVFRDTFGLMLYQEDVIRAAMAVAGCAAEDGDVLRRHLGKVHGGEAAQRDAFLVAGLKRGLDRDASEQVWEEMARFAGFSFCKAHAVTYGRIAYRCVYLKAHRPAAFLAAMLSNDAGYYDKGVYVEEAKRWGIRLRAPHVNHSERAFTIEPDPGSRGGFAIRVGLMEVRHLPAPRQEQIVAARRAGGPFVRLADVVARVPLHREELENLILCGAADGLGANRPELLWRARVARGAGGAPAAPGLFAPAPEPEPRFPSLPEYTPERRAQLEMELLGYSLDLHPVQALAPEGGAFLPIGAVEEHVGRTVTVRGMLVALRRLRTRRGTPMLFFSLEDATGVVEASLFPDRYRALAGLLQGRGPFVVRGRVEAQHDGIGLRVLALRET
ncbi:MAG: DNA polymerase III subunit alpha [Planctomycetes bacterium]|nr:DNA polymerase III subunit alpha [Planctomycetota bacterium]